MNCVDKGKRKDAMVHATETRNTKVDTFVVDLQDSTRD